MVNFVTLFSFATSSSAQSTFHQNRPETHFSPQLIGKCAGNKCPTMHCLWSWQKNSWGQRVKWKHVLDKIYNKSKRDDESHDSLAVKASSSLMWGGAARAKRFSLRFKSCAESRPFWVSRLIDVTDPLVMKQSECHYVCSSCAASHKHFPIDLQRARPLLPSLQGLPMMAVCTQRYS